LLSSLLGTRLCVSDSASFTATTAAPAAALPSPPAVSLAGLNDYDVQPNDAGYTATRGGMNRGCLRGPSTADFDLALYKRSVRTGASGDATRRVRARGKVF
jgi:hypothetical protein